MAVDMFLKIAGIDGEAQDKGHAKEIDILAWSWGASQSGTTHVGAGGGSGKVAVQDLSFTHYFDKASPNLWAKCATGAHLASATLTVRKAGGSPLEYIKIEMTEVMVTSVSTGGSGGEDRLTENVTLNFAKFKLTYTPQKADGTKDAEIPTTWNIATNTAD
ncbi:MAG TPA: type VI secretion system tube protein Hcp [Polyangiaceae bacterium]